MALEILEDLPDVDAIVAPLGGGGLLSGISAAVRELLPATKIFAAEPATAAPLSVSLKAGTPLYFDGWTASFVDGAGGKSVLESMWPLLRSIDGSIVVTLDEAAAAMKLVAERARVIAEGAALRGRALSGRAGTAGLPWCRGNIHHEFARSSARAAEALLASDPDASRGVTVTSNP